VLNAAEEFVAQEKKTREETKRSLDKYSKIMFVCWTALILMEVIFGKTARRFGLKQRNAIASTILFYF